MTSNALDSKIVLLGSASVGKTSIICRAVSDEFDKEMPATIGACYTAKEVVIADTTVTLQIWDTAGQDRFRTLAPMYYRGSVIAILVFSVTEEKSLGDVKDWADEMKEQTDEMPVLFVVGNKADLVDERTVTTDQGDSLAKTLNALYFEVSAKSGRGVDELFVRVAEESVKKLQTDPEAPVASDKGVNLVGVSKDKKKTGCNC
jgi:small GTP-binding protein